MGGVGMQQPHAGAQGQDAYYGKEQDHQQIIFYGTQHFLQSFHLYAPLKVEIDERVMCTHHHKGRCKQENRHLGNRQYQLVHPPIAAATAPCRRWGLMMNFSNSCITKYSRPHTMNV